MRNLALLFLLLFPILSWAQGTLTGTLLDENSGEPLMFASVYIEGTEMGTDTDMDGKYSFSLEPGSYTVVASYVGYGEKKVATEVKSNETTYVDFTMTDASIEMEAVVVKAEVIKRSENALMLLQRKSDKIQDGISAQEMSRFAVSNAASAMGKVTGASVKGGKYIFIRGLGDRYSLSQLNGLVIPSTDPYRNSAQLDLVPANLLENIITSKTFTPDQPGNFTGGNVNLQTKSIPESFFLTFSTSMGYNAQNNGIDNFLSYNGGKNDYWGFDDGTRARPTLLDDEAINQYANGYGLGVARFNINGEGATAANAIDEVSRSFNNDFTPRTKTSPLNHGYGFSFGNRYDVGGRPLGITLAGNFKKSFQHLEEAETNNWLLENDFVQIQGSYDDTKSDENSQLSGLAGIAYQIAPSHEISANFLYSHSATQTTRYLFGERLDNLIAPDFLQARMLYFQERELKNYQLAGEHAFPSLNNIKLDWKVSYADAAMTEPDTRFFENKYSVDDNTGEVTYSIPPSDVIEPFHYFRDLEDTQLDYKLDITIPITKTKGNKVKFGTLITQKDRIFNESRYQVKSVPGISEQFSGDIDAFMSPSNTGIVGDGPNVIGGYNIANHVVDASVKGNDYTGVDNVTAFYGMLNYQLTDKFKVIAGARYEDTFLSAVSDDENQAVSNIDEFDILPSANLVYSLSDKMNFRFAYSNTVARPNTREKAPFIAYDPPTKSFYLGNPDLNKSKIQNLDLRWEWFMNPGEIFAISSYYKQFEDPIIQIFRKASSPEIQFDNADSGNLLGVEVEFRKNLDFISPVLSNFKINTNVSFIQSSTDVIVFEGLEDLEPESRPFVGQPSYILNTSLIYENRDANFDALLTLNTKGDELFIIGREGTPDIYQRGRSQLDFTLSKKFGQLSLNLSARNILNADYLLSSSDKMGEYVYSRFQRGITYGVGVAYTIK